MTLTLVGDIEVVAHHRGDGTRVRQFVWPCPFLGRVSVACGDQKPGHRILASGTACGRCPPAKAARDEGAVIMAGVEVYALEGVPAVADRT